MKKLLYDISVLGRGFCSNRSRTGIYRVVEGEGTLFRKNNKSGVKRSFWNRSGVKFTRLSGELFSPVLVRGRQSDKRAPLVH